MEFIFALVITAIAIHLAMRCFRSRRRKAEIRSFWCAVDSHVAAYTGGTNTARVPVIAPSYYAYRPLAGERLIAVQNGVSHVGLKSTGRYVNSGFSYSVPIVRGLRYRVGFGTRTSEKAWQILDTGRILLTDKAVVYDGVNNERLTWAQIAEVDVFYHSIEISKRTGQPRVYRVHALDPHFAALIHIMSRQFDCIPVTVSESEVLPPRLPMASAVAARHGRWASPHKLVMGVTFGFAIFVACVGISALLGLTAKTVQPIRLPAPEISGTASDWGPTVVTHSIGKPDLQAFACSASPVALPIIERVDKLDRCRSAVRSVVSAMLANIEVTISCREEFLRKVGEAAPAAARDIRVNGDALRAMLPKLKASAEKELAQNATLAGYKQQLGAAQTLAETQPEFLGEWQGKLR